MDTSAQAKKGAKASKAAKNPKAAAGKSVKKWTTRRGLTYLLCVLITLAQLDQIITGAQLIANTFEGWAKKAENPREIALSMLAGGDAVLAAEQGAAPRPAKSTQASNTTQETAQNMNDAEHVELPTQATPYLADILQPLNYTPQTDSQAQTIPPANVSKVQQTQPPVYAALSSNTRISAAIGNPSNPLEAGLEKAKVFWRNWWPVEQLKWLLTPILAPLEAIESMVPEPWRPIALVWDDFLVTWALIMLMRGPRTRKTKAAAASEGPQQGPSGNFRIKHGAPSKHMAPQNKAPHTQPAKQMAPKPATPPPTNQPTYGKNNSNNKKRRT